MKLLNQLHESGIKISINGNSLSIDAPKGALSPDVLNEIRLRKDEIKMALRSLDYWLARVRQCESVDEVFAAVNQFRPGTWTDKQRAQMSQVYIPHLMSLREAD